MFFKFFLKLGIDKHTVSLYNQSVIQKREQSSRIKGENLMKEKRILAMFITSVVTLVASLAVTFGVLTTLADPVVATGVVRYAFAFNDTNDALIATEGKTLKIKENIIFNPSDELTWDEFENENADASEEPLLPVLVNSTEYDGELKYFDESVSSRIKMIPFRISNKSDATATTHIKVVYDKTTTIGKYTKVKVYDYKAGRFTDISDFTVELGTSDYRDYLVVVYVDETENTSSTRVNYGTDYEAINVEITNESIVG